MCRLFYFYNFQTNCPFFPKQITREVWFRVTMSLLTTMAEGIFLRQEKGEGLVAKDTSPTRMIFFFASNSKMRDLFGKAFICPFGSSCLADDVVNFSPFFRPSVIRTSAQFLKWRTDLSRRNDIVIVVDFFFCGDLIEDLGTLIFLMD